MNHYSGRPRDLMRRYGLTPEQYDTIFQEQDGRCAICLVAHIDTPRGLFVDHCHETQKVRGLLCHQCNTSIGRLGDNATILQRAADYLRAHEEGYYRVVEPHFEILEE